MRDFRELLPEAHLGVRSVLSTTSGSISSVQHYLFAPVGLPAFLLSQWAATRGTRGLRSLRPCPQSPSSSCTVNDIIRQGFRNRSMPLSCLSRSTVTKDNPPRRRLKGRRTSTGRSRLHECSTIGASEPAMGRDGCRRSNWLGSGPDDRAQCIADDLERLVRQPKPYYSPTYCKPERLQRNIRRCRPRSQHCSGTSGEVTARLAASCGLDHQPYSTRG